MTHPLTPREKVIEQLSHMARGKNTLYGSRVVAQMAIDHLTALASGSGDHAELIDRLRSRTDSIVETPLGPFRSSRGRSRNPDGPEAADALETLLAEIAALRCNLTKTERDYSELRDSYDRVSNKLCVERAHGSRETKRATEAERKLAEAVGLLQGVDGGAATQDWWRVKVRTFLGKEAERG